MHAVSQQLQTFVVVRSPYGRSLFVVVFVAPSVWGLVHSCARLALVIGAQVLVIGARWCVSIALLLANLSIHFIDHVLIFLRICRIRLYLLSLLLRTSHRRHYQQELDANKENNKVFIHYQLLIRYKIQ